MDQSHQPANLSTNATFQPAWIVKCAPAVSPAVSAKRSEPGGRAGDGYGVCMARADRFASTSTVWPWVHRRRGKTLLIRMRTLRDEQDAQHG